MHFNGNQSNAAEEKISLSQIRHTLRIALGLDLTFSELVSLPKIDNHFRQELRDSEEEVIALAEELLSVVDGQKMASGLWALIATIEAMLGSEEAPKALSGTIKLMIARQLSVPVLDKKG